MWVSLASVNGKERKKADGDSSNCIFVTSLSTSRYQPETTIVQNNSQKSIMLPQRHYPRVQTQRYLIERLSGSKILINEKRAAEVLHRLELRL